MAPALAELRTMLPACTDPQEVVLIVKGLLPRVKSDFTDATLVAFCKAMQLHLPCCEHRHVTRRSGRTRRATHGIGAHKDQSLL